MPMKSPGVVNFSSAPHSVELREVNRPEPGPDDVVLAVEAVGGLTLEQAVRTPEYGAPLVVIGAPLAVDADAFRTADGNLEGSLRIICDRVHAYGDVPVGKAAAR